MDGIKMIDVWITIHGNIFWFVGKYSTPNVFEDETDIEWMIPSFVGYIIFKPNSSIRSKFNFHSNTIHPTSVSSFRTLG